MDREKVIKGLECHHIDELNRINCADCPYYKEDDIAMDCLNSVHDDAISLMKEQQKQIEQMNFIYGFVYGGQVKEIKELVRCKDCKMNNQCSIQFKFADADNPGDWFCAYGERK